MGWCRMFNKHPAHKWSVNWLWYKSLYQISLSSILGIEDSQYGDRHRALPSELLVSTFYNYYLAIWSHHLLGNNNSWKRWGWCGCKGITQGTQASQVLPKMQMSSSVILLSRYSLVVYLSCFLPSFISNSYLLVWKRPQGSQAFHLTI